MQLIDVLAGRLMAQMFPTLMFIINASSVAVLWFGANRIDSGDMTVGSLVAFLTYFTLILISVMMGKPVSCRASARKRRPSSRKPWKL